MKQLISSGGYKREDIWIQTKFTSLDGQDPKRIPYDKFKAAPEQARESIEVSRRNLKCDVIDSLVLHSPMRDGLQATIDVWRAMEEAVDQGKVQILGISNCYDFQFFTQLYNAARHKADYDIQRREQELERRAKDLERRETELKNTPHNIRQNNWPPIPGWCPWGLKPFFYQDITMDIPAEFQIIVTNLYYLWLVHAALLLANMIVGFLFLF